MFLNDYHLRTQFAWREQILGWYDQHKRDFPWRRKISVYHTWICEVMSQQTTLGVVVPRFENFIERLPTVKDLAECSDDLLRELWSGLGYYARARNLRQGAQYIVSLLKGEFPSDFDGWLKVPGVGPYTASVISSICFRQPKACVDGNVIRVIARLTECSSSEIWSDSGKRSIQNLVDDVIDRDRPGDFNQAMMELGATLCQKQSPSCTQCPVQTACLANRLDAVGRCPPNKPRKQNEFIQLDALRVHSSSDNSLIAGSVLWVERKKGFLSDTLGFPLFKDQERVWLENWLRANSLIKALNFGENYLSHTITNHKISLRIVDVELFDAAEVDLLFAGQFLEKFAGFFAAYRWVSKSQTKPPSLPLSIARSWKIVPYFDGTRQFHFISKPFSI